ncbi:MAG TPA: SPOR domain-containing protein [Gemmatimonadaceae bacterium]|nr:SPOR domain-containing protein [Gemmatimonadaceae bacterium]
MASSVSPLKKRIAFLGGAVSVLAIAACGDARPPADAPLPTLRATGGPEIVLLRVTRTGGFPRSYRWPALDVPAWTGADRLPAIERLLDFDEASGLLTFVATDGRAGRIDLRTGRFEVAAKPLTNIAAGDGGAVFGSNSNGRIVSWAPSGEWDGPEEKVDTVLGLPDGRIVLASSTTRDTRLIRMRPPSLTPRDTISIPHGESYVQTQSGDRVYVRTDRGIMTVDTRQWRLASGPRSVRNARAVAPTPSGDRAFVLDESGKRIRVWERYGERFLGNIDLPFVARDLRMDDLGRFALARRDTGDSIAVISVPMMRVLRTLSSEWRDDLPGVAPDGSILTLRREDVNLMDPSTGARRKRLRGGGLDTWLFTRWDGFKPRDSSLDAPAVFEMDPPVDSTEEAEKIDSLLAERAAIVERERLDSLARATVGGRARRDTVGLAYTLSFASLLSESAARTLASRIRVDGRPPRVVAGSRDGVTIYRVVLGPYPTREAAEAAGRRSGVPFWVFAGLP